MAVHADFVARPMFEPHHCSFTLRSEDPEGFFQGRNLTGPADVALISVSRVRTYAEALGFVHPDDYARCERVTVELGLELEAARGELAKAQESLNAIYVLKRQAGFTAQRKPGRPSQKEAA